MTGLDQRSIRGVVLEHGVWKHRGAPGQKGNIEMRSDLNRKGKHKGNVLAIAALMGLSPSGCSSEPEVTLPADKEESAALCYAATLALAGEAKGHDQVTVEQGSQAAHFAFLGGSQNGVGEPTKVDSISARGQKLQSKIAKEKNAAGYLDACAKTFPETRKDAFKGLPADSPDTRMMCYTLSTALLQIFSQSDMAPDPRAEDYVNLNTRLDQSLMAELQAQGDINPGELAGRAMRGLAQAVRLGPPVDVMKACGYRYLKS